MVSRRVVHGGTMLTGPVLIGGAVREQLRDLTDLAPLHQPSPWPRSTQSPRSCPVWPWALLASENSADPDLPAPYPLDVLGARMIGPLLLRGFGNALPGDDPSACR